MFQVFKQSAEHPQGSSRFYLARILLVLICSGLFSSALRAQQALPFEVNLGEGSLSVPIQIAALLTLLSFIPAMVISMTAFTRIIVVAHFLRQALGTQQAPSNQILIGLTLFLTFFVMSPVLDRIHEEAVIPYQSGELSEMEALEKASAPLRKFMLRQAREQDLALFLKLAGTPKPASADELSLRVIVPAFMISELKTAFQIGFVLFVPFLVIDMVISSVLLSMGMMQLPPIIISTPFKLLLFILVDGWQLIVGSLMESFY